MKDDYIHRLELEKMELDSKRQKLRDFINSSRFSKVENKEKYLLKLQLQTMNTYSMILEERLK